jgi:choline-sulfatase
MGDEHSVFMTGCYGHRSVRTPTIDALAARGATFDAAYCPSPICAPSRAAMMTGCHVHRIGAWDNASPIGCDWPTFAHSFRAAGYRTVLAGKMHFVGPDQHHGFEERWTQDIYPADFRWTRPHHPQPPVNDGQNLDRVYEAGQGWTQDMDYDEEVMFRTEYQLRQSTRKDDPRPLLLVVSFTGPHYPFKAPEKYWSMYRDEDVDLPRFPTGDWRAREHAYVGWLRRHGKFDHQVPEDVCRRARRAILGRITLVDDYLARVIAAFTSARGAGAVTAYTSDHGDMMGEHGLWFKNAAYEWSSRVPFLIAGPGIRQRRIAEAVSTVDLGPTLCALAGIPQIFPEVDGRDLAPLLRGERPEGPGHAIVENYGEGMHRGLRTIRRGPWKLSYAHTLPPELFDLRSDPDEWTDLAGDERHRSTREELLAELMRGWDPAACDELRWESERRRIAIMKAAATDQAQWQLASPPLPHAMDWMRNADDLKPRKVALEAKS